MYGVRLAPSSQATAVAATSPPSTMLALERVLKPLWKSWVIGVGAGRGRVAARPFAPRGRAKGRYASCQRTLRVQAHAARS